MIPSTVTTIESEKITTEESPVTHPVDQITSHYYPQLDTLRTFAIVLVVVGHWFPYGHFLKRYWNNGQIGVGLFFVLSGFLIGNILLIEKNKLEEQKELTVWAVLKKFYVRRSLRIFPIYYLLLLILLIINYPSFVADIFPWLFFYASNIYMAISDKPFWPLDHTWTLAVEEQFYLILPLILLLVPKRFLLMTIVAFIATGVLSRAILYLYTEEAYKVLTICKFDYFGFGVLLAWLRMNTVTIPHKNLIGIIALLIYCVISTSYLPFTGRHSFINNFVPALPLFFAFLISKAADGFKGGYGKIFMENRMLIYIGKISYGIYLYHTLVPVLTDHILNVLQIARPSMYFKIGIDTLVVLLIAALSYRYIERPFNNLKRHFNY